MFTYFERRSLLVLWLGIFLFCHAQDGMTQVASSRMEPACLQKGWKKIGLDVNGVSRNLLWKEPLGTWKNGAIIVLHGGGGSCADWCGETRLSKPMAEFVNLAVANGFAVFALDSTMDMVTDQDGNRAGKRFDCIPLDNRANIDLPFIGKVIDQVIPSKRPADSGMEVFMAGISNGGFMTILASTYFDDKITAFAPVSAGDPYGTHMICSRNLLRKNAPGLFVDNETGKPTTEDFAAVADSFRNEKKWYSANPVRKPAFKQFHNSGDAGVDISCMRKAEGLLVQHGYHDDGAFVLPDGDGKRLSKHFWSRKYNQPMVDFFIRSRNQ